MFFFSLLFANASFSRGKMPWGKSNLPTTIYKFILYARAVLRVLYFLLYFVSFIYLFLIFLLCPIFCSSFSFILTFRCRILTFGFSAFLYLFPPGIPGNPPRNSFYLFFSILQSPSSLFFILFYLYFLPISHIFLLSSILYLYICICTCIFCISSPATGSRHDSRINNSLLKRRESTAILTSLYYIIYFS